MYAINRQHKTKSLVAVSSTQPLNADRFSVLKFHLPGHLPFQSLGKCDLPGLSKGQGGPCERMHEVTSRTFSGKSRDKDHGPYPGIRTRRDHGPLGLWISIYRTQVSMKDLDSGYFYIHLEVSH